MRLICVFRVAVSLALAAAAAAVFWPATSSVPPPIGVVIISLDTTRADRLSAYGYMGARMPHLDRLAADGIVFDQATSVAPLTLPAHTSLFTGLLPPAHGVRENASPALAGEHLTLAETLANQGFRTAAFVGSVVLDPDRGLAQGFDHYGGVASATVPERRQRRGDEVIGDATGWLEGIGEERFFLWAHLYDPHAPYDPPEPFRSEDEPYIGEIRFADAQIGRLVEVLERKQLLERTIIIVVGDHGESLGEHGEADHGIFLYENVLRVPFILRAPNVAAGRVGGIVRLTDVMPTVLDLLGIPLVATDGMSLVDRMRGSRASIELEAYAESVYPQRFGWSPLYALREGRYKFVEAPRPELYDLERDPFEQRNIYSERPGVARAFRDRLAAIQGGGASAAAAAPSLVPSELRGRLASLGYVAQSTGAVPTPGERLPDPKDCIGMRSGRPRAGGVENVARPAGCG